MIVQIDTREKSKAIQKILATFDANGIKHISSKLYVGDYMNLDNPKKIIDRKQNLSELCGNVCQQHERFVAELQRAKEAGIEIIILVEHSARIKSLQDVVKWNNPRLKYTPYAVSGERLYKILSTIAKKYGCSFEFCSKEQTGKKIIELLSVDEK